MKVKHQGSLPISWTLRPPETPEDEPVDKVELGRRLAATAGLAAISAPFPSSARGLTEQQRQEVMERVEPGDILLTTTAGSLGWELFEKARWGTDWTHAALYVGNGRVVEATTKYGVINRSLEGALKTHELAILRPRYANTQEVTSVVARAGELVGRPFDPLFLQGNQTEMFCSELVLEALSAQRSPQEIPVSRVSGRDMVSPDDFLKSPQVDVVWKTDNTFGKRMANYWPVAACSIAGAAVGGALFGWKGGVVGAAGGVVASSLLAAALK